MMDVKVSILLLIALMTVGCRTPQRVVHRTLKSVEAAQMLLDSLQNEHIYRLEVVQTYRDTLPLRTEIRQEGVMRTVEVERRDTVRIKEEFGEVSEKVPDFSTRRAPPLQAFLSGVGVGILLILLAALLLRR